MKWVLIHGLTCSETGHPVTSSQLYRNVWVFQGIPSYREMIDVLACPGIVLVHVSSVLLTAHDIQSSVFCG